MLFLTSNLYTEFGPVIRVFLPSPDLCGTLLKSKANLSFLTLHSRWLFHVDFTILHGYKNFRGKPTKQ